jgi:hypothetical protein
MHGVFLCFLFLQAHLETEAHFTADGMSSQRNQSDSFRFKGAAFYQSMKSKVGLAAAKAVVLRINLNVEGCGIVSAQVHDSSRVVSRSTCPPLTPSPHANSFIIRYCRNKNTQSTKHTHTLNCLTAFRERERKMMMMMSYICSCRKVPWRKWGILHRMW